MRLLLIRHGETDSNVALALDTAYPGAPLNDTGLRQAQELAERLADLPITAVVTSDLTRAVQTGEAVAARHGLTVTRTSDLRELQAGDVEMRTDAESFRAFEAVAVQWFSGHFDAVMPGGESGHATMDRLDRGIALACEQAGDGIAAVVAHGAAIRLWVGRRAQGSQIVPEMLRNTGVIEVEGSCSGGWRMLDLEPTLM